MELRSLTLMHGMESRMDHMLWPQQQLNHVRDKVASPGPLTEWPSRQVSSWPGWKVTSCKGANDLRTQYERGASIRNDLRSVMNALRIGQ